MAETFTATQTTVLTTDNDVGGPDGVIDPGDVVTTTVTIANDSTSTDATGVSFAETLDRMTLVGGTITVTPIAFDDPSYSTDAGVQLTVDARSGVLANDVDPNGPNSGPDRHPHRHPRDHLGHQHARDRHAQFRRHLYL